MTDTIHRAAERGDLDAVRRFVEVEGVNVDCKREWGDTPLIAAVRSTSRNNAPVIRYLISKNANVEKLSQNGNSALMVASQNGNVNAAKILLEEGHANVNARNRFDTTALAFTTSNPEGFCVVSTLLQNGADVAPSSGPVPLLCACLHPGSVEVVRQLLECGANVMEPQAIYNAAEFSDGATMRLLIAHGADVNASRYDRYPRTPLALATCHSNTSTVRALVEHNANVQVSFGYDEVSLLHIVKDDTICGILLDHCRSTLSKGEFQNFLLKADSGRHIALNHARSVQIAQLLVEQPRCHDKPLSPICHAQLVWENGGDHTPRHGSYSFEVREYLETFESLALSVPGGETCHDDIAVILNPALNDFQWSVAEEALGLIMTATGCPDSIAHGMMGYLSPLDVMKRCMNEKLPHCALRGNKTSLCNYIQHTRFFKRLTETLQSGDDIDHVALSSYAPTCMLPF